MAATSRENGIRNSNLIWWIAGLLAAAVLPYVPSLRGDFVLDDFALIVNDPLAHSLAFFPRNFSMDFLRGTLGPGVVYYRPLVSASYQANYMIAGPDPLTFRLFNLLLNVVAVMLVFALARRVTGSLTAAGIAGMAFAVLPSHAEAVSWVSGRTDAMSCLFAVGALVVFAAAWDREPRFTWPRGFACAVLFLCALLSKENALAVPVLAGGYAWIRGRPVRRDDLAKWIAAFAVPLLVYMAVRRHAVHVTVVSHMTFLLGRRLLGVGIAYAAYLRMLFVPQAGRVVYDVFPIGLKYPILAALAWLIPIGLAVVTVRLRKRLPVVSFGAMWILVTLLPVTNILPTSGPVPAERFVYLASVGSAIVLGWLAKLMLDWRPGSLRVWPAVITAIVAWYVLYCGALTVQSCEHYQSNVAWSRAVSATDGRFFRSWAGYYFSEAGLYKEAAHEYEAAIKHGPPQVGNYTGLATALRRLGKPRRAAEVLLTARNRFPPIARIELNLGMALGESGDLREAAGAFREATRLDPKSFGAWRGLGKASLSLGNYREAIAAYEHALALDPASRKHRAELAQARERAEEALYR